MTPTTASHDTWLIALLWAAVYSAVPLVLAAVGGVLAERAGVVNIALEGLMLAGAFVGVAIGQRAAAAGLLAALVVGGLLGLLHGALTQKAGLNQIVSGLGINLFVAGVTRYLSIRMFPSGVQTEGIPKAWFVPLAVILPFLVAALLLRTRFGLRLRAVGEDPESARLVGVRPVPVRLAALILSGMAASLGGAYLSVADTHTFSRDMTAGKGYIALAAVIFGKWHPVGAAAGALLFGFFYALQTQVQITGASVTWLGVEWTSPVLLDTLPYSLTLLALISVVGRAVPPASLGRDTTAP